MKRIVIKVTDQQHNALIEMARATGETISNYVRKSLGFPSEQKGERKDLRKKRSKA